MKTIPASKHAFTLIELLIVVTIIAILAAIAVPNFLEAQTRAKVSRVKNDIRRVVTGVELYRIDHGQLPIPADSQGASIENPENSAEEWFETKTPPSLTTPIAYLTARPPDVFMRQKADASNLFHYSSHDFRGPNNRPAGQQLFANLHEHLKGAYPPQPIQFCLLSFGPDQDHDVESEAGHDEDDDHGHEHGHGEAAIYDPSNGAVSNGDIYYMGPGPGFL